MAKDIQEKHIVVSRNIWPTMKYEIQPAEDIAQLTTVNDQLGNTAVEHIFKKTREVYGQPPLDAKKMEWKDYNILFQHRPSPYDFPAFEHERVMSAESAVQQSDPHVSALGGPNTQKPAALCTAVNRPSPELAPQSNVPEKVKNRRFSKNTIDDKNSLKD